MAKKKGNLQIHNETMDIDHFSYDKCDNIEKLIKTDRYTLNLCIASMYFFRVAFVLLGIITLSQGRGIYLQTY